MKMLHLTVAVSGLLLASLAGQPAWADVFNMGGTRNAATGQWTGLASLETVPVGNPGNAADSGGYGKVDYNYRIGKYEVTAGQYCEFLNKVAGVDDYGLYDTSMRSTTQGCQIERFSGSGTASAPYQYRVALDYANRPVSCVSFWDACRFANWLHNGQPTGGEGAGTTETGVYTLNGYNGSDGHTIQRNANWQWAVTSENEWYKAAYYDAYKAGGAGYWLYPTATDSVPSNSLLTPDGGNNANYYHSGYTLGSPYYRTVVGEFENSDSPYGTFDQGGNVFEWNEAIPYSTYRGQMGGAYAVGPASEYLRSSFHGNSSPAYEVTSMGFRVVQVPEPATLSLLALGGLLTARRRHDDH